MTRLTLSRTGLRHELYYRGTTGCLNAILRALGEAFKPWHDLTLEFGLTAEDLQKEASEMLTE